MITEFGDVVDSITKRMFKSGGELLGIDRLSQSVIIERDRSDDHGVYAFDLSRWRCRRLRRPGRWAMPGIASPSGKLSASGEGGDEIWLHRPSGEKTLLGKGFSRWGTLMCSESAKPTFIWLDDTRLLTQRGNGHLFVLDINGRAEPLVTTENFSPSACGPELQVDRGGRIYYEKTNGDLPVDVAKRSVSPYVWEAAGNGFELQHERNRAHGLAIRYHETQIGEWWCDDAVTAPGHIAVAFGPVGSNLGNPKGVKVWSSVGGGWITIEPKWIAAIVGWTAN